MKLQEMSVKEMFDYSKRQGDKVYDIVNKETRTFKMKGSNALDEEKVDKIYGLGKLYKKEYMTAMNREMRTPHNQKGMEIVVRKLVKIRKEIVAIVKEK